MKTDEDTRDVFAAPQKIVDGLKEAFEGFAKMFEGISDQLESLAEAADEDEDMRLQSAPIPDKPVPALSEKKGTVKRPHKTPGRKPKAAETVVVEETEESSEANPGETDVPAPTDEDAPPDSDASPEDDTSPDDTPDWPPNDTPPWEPPKEEAPKTEPKAAEPKPTESKPTGATITKDDIRSVIVAKIKQKKNVNDKVQSLLAVYGVKALSDLPEDKHEAFLADISQL